MSADPPPLTAVLVVASEDDGGAARSVALLARHLPEAGVRVHVAVHREGPFTAWLGEAGASFDVVPELIETGLRASTAETPPLRALIGNLGGMPTAVRRLRAICAEQQADVLYSHNTWCHYQTALAGRGRHRRPVVWHVRNDQSAPQTRLAGRWLARSCQVRAIIAVSAAMTEPFQGLGIPTPVIYNGTEIPGSAAGPRGQLRRRLGVGPDAVLVGFAGRLAAHKGIAVLQAAFALAARRSPVLHLVVLGGSARHTPGDEVQAIRDRAAAEGLAGRVHPLGWVDDVGPDLAGLDLCVVPSICEDGCPRAAIEAMALGVPIVGSRIGGIPEIVSDGVSGVLVPAGDPLALADALVELAADRDRRRTLGGAGARRAKVDFDAGRVAEQVAAVLRDAAGGGSAS